MGIKMSFTGFHFLCDMIWSSQANNYCHKRIVRGLTEKRDLQHSEISVVKQTHKIAKQIPTYTLKENNHNDACI